MVAEDDFHFSQHVKLPDELKDICSGYIEIYGKEFTRWRDVKFGKELDLTAYDNCLKKILGSRMTVPLLDDEIERVNYSHLKVRAS